MALRSKDNLLEELDILSTYKFLVVAASVAQSKLFALERFAPLQEGHHRDERALSP